MSKSEVGGRDENLLLRNQHEVEGAVSAFLAQRIRDECPKIERARHLAASEFKERFVKKSKPVILSGLCDSWAGGPFFTFDYLVEECGNVVVQIDPYDDAFGQMDIKTLVERIKQSSPNNPIYLKEWWFQESNAALLKDLEPVEHFADDWGRRILGFVNRTLWIGSRGAKTPIHQDAMPFNICSLQLTGIKEWFLFGRNAYLHERRDGGGAYCRFLSDPASQAMSGKLERGEILFVPHGWWHRTETLEHSASVNSMYITEDIVQEYVRGLFTMPLLMALRQDELKERSLLRYNTALKHLRTLAFLIEFDSEYALHALSG